MVGDKFQRNHACFAVPVIAVQKRVFRLRMTDQSCPKFSSTFHWG